MSMRLIAKDNFQPRGASRPVRAGEVFEADNGLAVELIQSGLAVPAPPMSSPGPTPAAKQTMTKGPKERRGAKRVN